MPRFVSSGQSGRSYRIPGIETPFVSVTTAIGVLNKPLLVNWAARMAAARAVEHIGELSHLIECEGVDEACKWVAKASGEYSKDRRTLGSIVHWLVETHENPLHTQDDVDSKVDWYLKDLPDPDAIRAEAELCFAQYRDWLSKTKPKFLLREHTVFNSSEGYAGTLDCIADIGGRILLGDYKTGGIYPESLVLQLAAYRHAEHYLLDDDRIVDMPTTEGAFCLNIKADGWTMEEYTAGEKAQDRFLSALAVYRWVNTSPSRMAVM